MGSTAEQVRRRIQEDVFLQVALARGIVGYRKMARWLAEHHDVSGTESAIAQAIERNHPDEPPQAVNQTLEVLASSRVDHHGGLGLLAFPLTAENARRLPKVLERAEVERGGSFRSLQRGGSMTLILDRDVLAEAQEELDDIDEDPAKVGELRVVPDQPSTNPAMLVSLVTTCLAVNGITPEATTSSDEGVSAFVTEDDASTGFEVLERLTE